jgi:hypothetical protein
MFEAQVFKGTPDIVNLQEGRYCPSCNNYIPKRKQMWKYPGGEYLCIVCKTKFDLAELDRRIKDGWVES